MTVWNELADRSDEDLLELARAGDQSAAGELCTRALPAARRYAVGLGATSPDDVVAEAIVRVLEAMAVGGGPTKNFQGYLLSSVHALAHARKTFRREAAWEADVAGPVRARDDTERDALADIDRHHIEAVLAAMPEREARLLRAVEMDGTPVAEVAVAEGVTPNYASVILRRGRRSFQRLWIQRHANPRSGANKECRWVLQHAGAYLSRSMKGALARRVEHHLSRCVTCREALEEVRVSSHNWGRAAAGAIGLLPATFVASAWGSAPVLPITIGMVVAAAGAGLGVGLMASAPADAPTPPVVVTTTVASPPPSTVTVTAPPETTPSVTPTEPTSPPAVTPTTPSRPRTSAPRAALTVTADAGPGGLCFPQVFGTGEPGQKVSIGGFGWGAEVVVGRDGRWTTGRVDGVRGGVLRFSVVYADGGGAISGSVQVATPPNLSVVPGPGGLEVGATGRAGASIQVLVDGRVVGRGVLDAGGAWQGTLAALPAGDHTVGVRYAPTGCVGPSNTVSVTAG